MTYINRKKFRQVFSYELRDKLKPDLAYDKDNLDNNPYNYIAYVVDKNTFAINTGQGLILAQDSPLLRQRIEHLENEFVERVINTLEKTAQRHELDYDNIVWDDSFIYSNDNKSILRYTGPESRTHIIVPVGVEIITRKVFNNHNGLAIVFPNTLISIGDQALRNWVNATTLTLPDSVVEVGECAFEGWQSLETLYLSQNLTELSPKVFKDTYNLTNLVLPDSITRVGESALENSGLSGKLYLKNVTEVGVKAFKNNNSLKEVVLGSNLVYIGDEAFSDCENLIELLVLSETPPSLGLNTLTGVDLSELVIYVYDNLVETYKEALGWSIYRDNIEPMSLRGLVDE